MQTATILDKVKVGLVVLGIVVTCTAAVAAYKYLKSDKEQNA